VYKPVVSNLKSEDYQLDKVGLYQFINWIVQERLWSNSLNIPYCGLIIIMRPSSLGGGLILRRTLSVRLSIRPSRYHYRASRRAT